MSKGQRIADEFQAEHEGVTYHGNGADLAARIDEAIAEELEAMAGEVDRWKPDDYSASGFARALRARAARIREGKR